MNDLFVYRSYTALLVDGYLPYRDFPFEYPPLAPLALLAGGIAGTGEEAYRLAFAAAMLAAALAALAATGAVARLTGGSERRALLAFAALPLAAGAMLRTHFDLAPVALALAALASVLCGRVRLGFALAGAGAMTKAFPLVVALAALVWLGGRGDWQAARRGAAALLVTLSLIGGAWLALSPSGAIEAVEYHLDRPVQVESVPASLVHAAGALGLAGAPEAVSSHRSDGLRHPAAGTLAAVVAAALVAVLAWLAAALARRPGQRSLALGALAAVAATATLGKVLSPQFLIWIAPLGALAFGWRMHALAAAVAVATLLTLAEFPSRYFDVVAGKTGALALVGARNAAMLAVVALALRALRREPVRGSGGSRSPARPPPPRPAPR
ncbi:MAG TPA: glycosyltransferase 87 family protein [Thermoleophilaceae bacterium]|nr:glycosyltransferase 87 family protein [Thermoleophilaceae bacterium]